MRICSPLIVAITLALAACAGAPSQAPQQASPAAATEQEPRIVKSRDGSFEGEVFGSARPGSKFASLQIGMQMDEVQTMLGRAPDRWHTYESGKRWIPFYYGSDARRLQALYKDGGCLVFTHGNVWGGAGGELIQIEHDSSGACYQP